jgi:hypothetical protein
MQQIRGEQTRQRCLISRARSSGARLHRNAARELLGGAER